MNKGERYATNKLLIEMLLLQTALKRHFTLLLRESSALKEAITQLRRLMDRVYSS